MSTWIWLLVIIGAVWYFMRSKKQPPMDAPVSTEVPVTPQPIAAPIEQPSEDPFLVSVARAAQQANATAEQQVAAHAKQLGEKFDSDVAVRDRLSKFAYKMKLDVALREVYDEIKNYPSWSQRTDWPKWNKLNLSGIDGSGVAIGKDRNVSFKVEEQTFEMKEHPWSGYDGDSYADLTLLEDGKEMFAVTNSIEYGDYTSYRTSKINAFKKEGNWAAVLLQLHAEVRAHSKKSLIESNYFKAEEIKDRFKE